MDLGGHWSPPYRQCEAVQQRVAHGSAGKGHEGDWFLVMRRSSMGGKQRGEEVRGMLQVSLAPHCCLCVCSSRTSPFVKGAAQTSPDDLQALKLYGYGAKVDGV